MLRVGRNGEPTGEMEKIMLLKSVFEYKGLNETREEDVRLFK